MNSISVVIPAHNAGRTLEAAVASIVNQSRPVQEVIIVENGSTDDTFEIATSLASCHDVITVMRSEPGVSVARNTGIRACRSDYIGWLDADDTYTRDAMEVLSYFANKHAPDFVKGNLLYNFGATNKIWRPNLRTFNSVSNLRMEPNYPDYVGTVCAIYSRHLLSQLTDPFPVGVRTAEDRAFVWRTLLRDATFVHVDRVVYNYDKTSETSVLKKVDGPHFDLFMAYGSVIEETGLTDYTPVNYKFWHSYISMMHFTYARPERLSDQGRSRWIAESRKAIAPIRGSAMLRDIVNSANAERKQFLKKVV